MTGFSGRIPVTDGWVDVSSREMHRGGQCARLTELELKLLHHMATVAPRIVTTQELLQEVWGYARPAPTRAVHTAVQRLRRKVEVRPSNPTLVLTVHGEGFRYVAPPTSGNDLPQMWGRTHELAAVKAHLANGTSLTVTGMVGVGKSLVAQSAVRDLEGWVSVPLRGVDTTDAFWQVLVQALGQPPRADQDARPRALDALRNAPRRGLLLDDCDSLQGVSQLIDDLTLDTVTLLLTMRRPLGVAHENVLHLSPLGTESARQLLWVTSGQQGKPPVDDPSFSTLIQATGGLPLALRLMGSYLPVVPAAELAKMLATDLLSLTANTSSPYPNMNAAIRSAVGLLAPHLRSALARLAAFRAPFGLDAATAVLGCRVGDASTILFALGQHSMLVTDREAEHTLFSLPTPIDVWARTDDAATQHAHAAWFARLGSEAFLDTVWTDGGSARHTLLAALPDLSIALDWALESASPSLVVPLTRAVVAAAGARTDSTKLIDTLRRSWQSDVLTDGHRRALVSTIATLRQLDLIRSLDGLVERIPHWLNDATPSQSAVLQALALSSEHRGEGLLALGTSLGLTHPVIRLRLHVLGASAAVQHRNYELVETHLERGLPLASELGDARSESTLLYVQMRLHRGRAELRLASLVGERGATVAHDNGLDEDAFVCRAGAAYIHLDRSPSETAIDAFETALVQARRLGLTFYTHQLETTLCSALVLANRTDAAATSAGRLQTLARMFPVSQCVQQAWWATGICALHRGETLTARVAFQHALDASGPQPLISLYVSLTRSLPSPTELAEAPALQALLPFGRGLFWCLVADICAHQDNAVAKQAALSAASREHTAIIQQAVRLRRP